MTILVTGGSGFIGRNLVEQLATSHEILAPSHAELDLIDSDAVARYLRKHPVEAIVHAATKPGHRNAKDATGLLFANTRMFINLGRWLRPSQKLIFLSTGAAYDSRHYVPKMGEDYFDVHVPVDDTGYSKYLCAKYVELFPNAVELRPFGVFGKYEDWEIRFISNAICKTLYDLPITIKRNRRMDYVYVDDLVAVIARLLTAWPAESAFNVTGDSSYELAELAERVRTVSGKDLPITIAAAGMDSEYSGSNQRLRTEIPNLELTPIDAAITRLYTWYEEHRDAIDPTLLRSDK
jgi:UDP-glucose 4-epimerase